MMRTTVNGSREKGFFSVKNTFSFRKISRSLPVAPGRFLELPLPFFGENETALLNRGEPDEATL